MTNFDLIFYACLLLTAGVTFRSSEMWKTHVLKQSVSENKEDAPTKQKWVNLLSRYLLVYLLATLSDWLQGPYVYALYRCVLSREEQAQRPLGFFVLSNSAFNLSNLFAEIMDTNSMTLPFSLSPDLDLVWCLEPLSAEWRINSVVDSLSLSTVLPTRRLVSPNVRSFVPYL